MNKIKPPKGYRLMKSDERPDWKEGDIACVSAQWFGTGHIGVKTVAEAMKQAESVPVLAYARKIKKGKKK